MDHLSRRAFLLASVPAGTACVVSMGIAGCNLDDGTGLSPVRFTHGVASGDPLSDSVIIWTRATPLHEVPVIVSWEVATDAAFTQLVNQDSAVTDAGGAYARYQVLLSLQIQRYLFGHL